VSAMDLSGVVEIAAVPEEFKAHDRSTPREIAPIHDISICA